MNNNAPRPEAGLAGPVLVDAHVHIHGCFRVSSFLTAAARNFAAAATSLGLPSNLPGCLLLTETAEADAFCMLREIPQDVDLDGWEIRRTSEAETLIAECPGRTSLLIVAGRQIATTDGLEVLALFTTRRFEPGPLERVIQDVCAARAVAAVPWGFGKWTMKRGHIVARALTRPRPRFFLGDNSGRARLGQEPRLFARARRAGLLILPGTDPLPFEDQEDRAGSYGFVADVSIDPAAPARSVREWLMSTDRQPRVYGRGERTAAFIRNQIRMQLRKRLAV